MAGGNGGRGSAGNGTIGRGGTVSNGSTTGTNGTDGQVISGGLIAGGGGGAGGGRGGSGAAVPPNTGGAGGRAGANGTSPVGNLQRGEDGASGGDASDAAGGGGGGGGHGAILAALTAAALNYTGGAGGSGGRGIRTTTTDNVVKPGGGGGEGGYGVVVDGTVSANVNAGVVTGGTGGSGGASDQSNGGGRGSDGGVGVYFTKVGHVLTNTGSIAGGDGGLLGVNARAGGLNPAGGAGIVGADLTVINAGSIAGGRANGGRSPVALANAITFTGGSNVLAFDTDASFRGAIGVQAGTLTFDQSRGSGFSADALLSAAVTGAGSVTKVGSGTLTLSGTSTYTGGTSVVGGTLIVDGSLTSAVTVGAGATLGGHGSVGGVTITGGTFSPGNSPGIMRTGNLTLDSSSTFVEEIGGAAPAASSTNGYDQTIVTGSVTLGNATLDLRQVGDFQSSPGEAYRIIDNDGSDGVVGTFAGLPEGATVSFGGQTLRISYRGGDGNDVTLGNTTPLVREFTVTSTADTDGDTSQGAGNAGTLRQAINFANANPNAQTIIRIAPALSGQTIRLDGYLPLISADVVLQGNGAILDGAARFRGFFVTSIAGTADGIPPPITVAMSDLAIQNVLGRGGRGGDGAGGGMGAGGAVFVGGNANVTLTNVDVSNAVALGGAAGTAFAVRQTGGGGGLGGDGGDPPLNPAASGDGGNIAGSGIGPGADDASYGGAGPFAGGGGTGLLSGGKGGFGGGGGGGGYGDGGFGGGGGGGSYYFEGGDGGFGGGGGATSGRILRDGNSGVGAGTPFDYAGGGGLAAGGAIFVTGDRTIGTGSTAYTIPAGTLTVLGGSFTNNQVTRSIGSNPGAAAGQDLFLMTGARTTLAAATGQVLSFSGTIADDSAASLPAGSNYVPGSGAGEALVIGSAGATGRVVLSNGANTYSGGTTFAGGIANAGGAGALGTTGTLSFAGGTLQYGAANQADYSARFSQAAGQLYSIDTNGQAVTFGSALTSNGGTLNVTGSGSLTLSVTNTYTGATTVSSGTLLVNGSIAASATTVGAGGTLGGSGTTGAVAVQSGGTLSAGNSPGILNTGDLVLTAGGTLREEIAGAAAGAGGYDQVNVSGTVNLGSAALDLTLLNGYNPAINTSFTVINNDETDAVTGTFANLSEGATVGAGGRYFRISYAGGTGNDVTLTAISPPLYSIALSPAAVAEGTAPGSAGGTLTYTVTRTGDTSRASTVNVGFSGTANPASDYTVASTGVAADGSYSNGVLTFAAGQSTARFVVTATPDSLYESDETVIATISNPSQGGVVSTPAATGAITNDDTAPSLSVAEASLVEGNGGTANLVFTVTLSAVSGLDTTVAYATSNGTATAGSDYVATTGTLTIAAGQTSGQISVAISGDPVFEGDETFNLTLSRSTNATLARATALGTIINDDAPADPAPLGPTPGEDDLVGTSGPDTIGLLAGNDTYTGGAGNDLIYGNQGNDLIYGNQDADTLYGGQGDDRAYGGQAADRLYGNIGDDVLFGNLGADIVYGNPGADIVYGNQGADILFGGQGNDVLYGGQDADMLVGGIGDDTLVGGLGADLYRFDPNSARDLILGFNQAEGDRIALGGQTYTVNSAQNGDALLTLSAGGVVNLAGIRADQVNASYFAV